jgi:hypothetical protein
VDLKLLVPGPAFHKGFGSGSDPKGYNLFLKFVHRVLAEVSAFSQCTDLYIYIYIFEIF